MTNNEKKGQIILYSIDTQKEFVNVIFEDENFWLTQKSMAELQELEQEIAQGLKELEGMLNDI